MSGMKLSISLSEDDVGFLDAYARHRKVGSRSAVVQRAVHLLRLAELEEAYEQAWEEWDDGDDAGLWDATAADGLSA